MRHLLALALLLSGCASSQSDPGDATVDRSLPNSSSTRKSQHAEGAIRSVDFANFVYDWYPDDLDIPAAGKRIVLESGSMDTEFGPGKEPGRFILTNEGAKYGDLTHDGQEEAVVVLGIITSGSARSHAVFVYGIEQGKPRRMLVYQTGDRWDYGFRNASINDGQLVIERYKPMIAEGESGKHDLATSDTYIRDIYKWNGKRFDRIKSEEVPADPSDRNPWVRRG